MDAELNCQNCLGLQIDGSDTYSSCVVDVDVEKDSLQAPGSNDKAIESLKSESVLNVSSLAVHLLEVWH